jgi:hypothetical protein
MMTYKDDVHGEGETVRSRGWPGPRTSVALTWSQRATAGNTGNAWSNWQCMADIEKKHG